MKERAPKPHTNELTATATIADLVDLWVERESVMAPYYQVMWDRVGSDDTVVEFGLRRGGSTAAFLHTGAIVISYDMMLPAVRLPLYEHLAKIAGGRWAMVFGDTRVIPIPACDWLLVDSEHTYDQVKAELRTAVVRQVRKGIMFHDTIVHRDKGMHKQPGIWKAIEEFMASDAGFSMDYHADHGVGFTVLKR